LRWMALRRDKFITIVNAGILMLHIAGRSARHKSKAFWFIILHKFPHTGIIQRLFALRSLRWKTVNSRLPGDRIGHSALDQL
jgi:hypothetical protein